MNRMIIKIGCMVTVFSMIICETASAVYSEEYKNNESVLISEVFDENGGDRTNPESPAELAVDGNENTYWSVYSEAVKGSIVIDLGNTEDINSIRIIDKNAKISDYSFEYSQNLSEWYELGTGDSQGKEEKLDVFPSVKARYVKVCINECRDEQGNGGFDIGEIKVYYDSSVNIKNDSKSKKIYKDVNGGTAFGSAINLLTELGIVSGDDNGYFKPNAKITRGEFARMITNIWPEDSRINGELPFDDIADEEWLKEAVSNVYGYNIMVGDGGTKFRPNDMITGAETVKTLVTLLGYTEMTEYMGEYPYGYFKIAARIGMMEDSEVEADSLITRKQAAKLIANSLDIDMMDVSGIKNGENMYETVDETLLTKYRSIYNSKGIITANEFTGIDTKNGVKTGTVKILDDDNDEYIYSTGSTDAGEYLGSRVKYYYHTDKHDQKTLLVIEEYKTTVNEIEAENITGINGETITYYKDESKKIQKISLTAPVIKNGVYMGKLAHALTDKDLAVDSGSVVFIDNNNDSKADVIIIKSFVTGIIDNVSVNMNKIFLKNAEAIEFDFDNEANRIIKDSKKIEAEDLNVFDVVSIMKSDDSDIITVYVSSYQPIEGAIELYSGEYRLSDRINFDGIVYSREDLQNKLKLIPSATVYLNFKKEIAGIFSRNVKEQYGYLISAAYEDIGDENKLYVKVFTQGGKISRYVSGEKVKVDGKRIEAEKAYKKLLNGTTVQKQMIRFSVNTENILTEIILPDIAAGEQGKAYEGDESLIPYGDPYQFKSQRFYWKKGLGNAQDGVKEFVIADTTLIMQIPLDGNEKDFRLLTRDTFQDSTNYDVMAYNVSKTGEAAVVAVSLSAAENVRHDITTYMVKKVSETIDAYDDVVIKLECVSQGKESSIFCDEDTTVFQYKVSADGTVKEEDRIELTVSDIKAGALIQYSGDTTASSIRLVYPKQLDYQNPDSPWNFAYGWSGEKVFGKVYAIKDSKIAVKTGLSMSYYSLDANLKFHVWNAESKTCETGNFADILTVENAGEDEASYFYYAPYTKSMFIFNY